MKKTVKKTTIVQEISSESFDKTHIICVLDRSGSMSSIIEDMIGGFNQFLEEQKKLEGECVITISMFDHDYTNFKSNVDINSLEPLTLADWQPRGTTALYDAIGKSINDVKSYYVKNPSEKPDRFLVCIVTDGYENSSKEYRLDDIKKLIDKQQKNDWAFVYLAANQDGFAVGNSMNISSGNVFNYTADVKGTRKMSAKLGDTVSYYRSVSSDQLDMNNLVHDSSDTEKNSQMVKCKNCQINYGRKYDKYASGDFCSEKCSSLYCIELMKELKMVKK